MSGAAPDGSHPVSRPLPVFVVGVLSDTHGQLHPQVKERLKGVQHIVHAGDIGSSQVLSELRTLAPVTAVRGNCDHGPWAETLPLQGEVELAGVRMVVTHIRAKLPLSKVSATERSITEGDRHVDVVISGHTHRAAVEQGRGWLDINPGSAGPQRFGRTRSIALLTITRREDEGGAAHPQVEVDIIPIMEP